MLNTVLLPWGDSGMFVVPVILLHIIVLVYCKQLPTTLIHIQSKSCCSEHVKESTVVTPLDEPIW